MSSSTISRIQVVLLRVSSLLRSNHQATAKIDGYNPRYRENRTKNTRRGGAWRVSYAASCRLTGAWIWWSDPIRSSSWGSLFSCERERLWPSFSSWCPSNLVPRAFSLEKGRESPGDDFYANADLQMDTNMHGGRRNRTGETSVSNFVTKAWIHFSRN